MEIGEFIKAKRKENKLTLKQVGNYVGVANGTVSKWERGYIKCMNFDKIMKLAIILNISPAEFFKCEIKERK